jgi:hypothetical protein
MSAPSIDAPINRHGASIFRQMVTDVHKTPVQRSSANVAGAIDQLLNGLANLDNRQGWAKGGLTLYNIAKRVLGSDKAATRFCQRFHDDLDALKDIAAKLKNGGTISQATLREISTILKRMDGNWNGLGALSKKLGEVGAASILIGKRSELLGELQTRIDTWREKLDLPQGSVPSMDRGTIA